MAKSKSYSEPEEDYSGVDNADYNPLEQPINEKPYTRPNVTLSEEDMMNDIPEPMFQPPPIDLGKKDKEAEEFVKEKKPPIEPLNKEMGDLPKKEKTQSAKYMANVIIDGYATMVAFANKGLLFSEKKIRTLQQSGEVDFSLRIPYDHMGNMVTLGEFVQMYNEQNKDAMSVSEDFKNEIRPVLTQVLEKRGVGMTIEQQLMYLGIKNMIGQGMIYFAGRQTMNEMMQFWKDMTANSKPNQNMSYATPPPPPPSAPSEPPPMKQEFQPIIDVDDFDLEPIEVDDYQFTEDNYAPTVNEMVESQTTGVSINDIKKKKGRGRPKKS